MQIEHLALHDIHCRDPRVLRGTEASADREKDLRRQQERELVNIVLRHVPWMERDGGTKITRYFEHIFEFFLKNDSRAAPRIGLASLLVAPCRAAHGAASIPLRSCWIKSD